MIDCFSASEKLFACTTVLLVSAGELLSIFNDVICVIDEAGVSSQRGPEVQRSRKKRRVV